MWIGITREVFMKKQGGFTLMELLVVLLIIGVLSTVAVRTIDATRDRSLFDQTAKEMKELVYAMVGNPDIVANGKRVDFGFYGDMMRLPADLRELVENTTQSPSWRGPYLRRDFLQDSIGYRFDAWGNPYTYDAINGTIATLGNGKYPMTMRVTEAISHLTNNWIVGNVSDIDNAPPGDKAATIGIKLYLPNGSFYFTRPDGGGFYQFSPETHGPVPIGVHKIVATRPGGDSIIRWVTITPRSKVVVDFRFTGSFRNYLEMIGEPILFGDSAGFRIKVVNSGVTVDSVKSIRLLIAPDSAYLSYLRIFSITQGGMPQEQQFSPRPGKGDSMFVDPSFSIQPNKAEEVELSFYGFCKTPNSGDSTKANIYNKLFRLRFNDGSEFAVTPVRQ
ncbi:MAG: type II secretion system protein [bacterium]